MSRNYKNVSKAFNIMHKATTSVLMIASVFCAGGLTYTLVQQLSASKARKVFLFFF